MKLNSMPQDTSDSSTSLFSKLPTELARRVVRAYAGPDAASSLLTIATDPIRPPPAERFEIFARKRPLWKSEAAEGEYDALTIDEDVQRCIVHDGKAARDMSTYTQHREFALDGVYAAATQERDLLARVVDPLLAKAAAGQRASLILFGQTGTGKTYTSHNMQRYLATQLLAGAEAHATADEVTVEREAEGAHWACPPPPEVLPRWATKWRSLRQGPAEAPSEGPSEVVLEVFELREKKAYDLLNERKVVRLVADKDEHIHVLGGVRLHAKTSEQLLEALTKAHKLRSVAATERNAQSSRSHCVCRLRIVAGAASDNAGVGGGGMLTLVDLAGSERNYETTKHDRQATRESADINLSLQTLKECFRATINKDVDLETLVEIDQDDVEWTRAVPKGYKAAMAAAQKAAASVKAAGEEAESAYNGLAFDPAKPAALMNFALYREAKDARSLHMPYRRHQLTLLLKDCFTNPDHRTAVVACCSPAARDVEHTVRTLNQVCQMRGAEDEVARTFRVECQRTTEEAEATQPFRKWSAERVREWLLTLENELSCAAIALPDQTDGKELLQRWPVGRIAFTCFQGHAEKARRLYAAIRDEASRVDALLADRRVRMRGIAGRSDDRFGPDAAAKKQAAAAAALQGGKESCEIVAREVHDENINVQ